MNKILPATIDNTFRGYQIALWFFYLITLVTIIRSCVHIVTYDGGAQSIATIPLDSYTDAGAATIVLIFAYWGLSQLMFAIIQFIVAIRYKSLIPLMYIMLILDWGGRFIISLVKSIDTTGIVPGGIGNKVMPFLCLILFFLSTHKNSGS